MTGILLKERRGRLNTQEINLVEMEAEIGVKEQLVPPKVRRGKILLYSLRRGHDAANTLISKFYTPEL